MIPLLQVQRTVFVNVMHVDHFRFFPEVSCKTCKTLVPESDIQDNGNYLCPKGHGHNAAKDGIVEDRIQYHVRGDTEDKWWPVAKEQTEEVQRVIMALYRLHMQPMNQLVVASKMDA